MGSPFTALQNVEPDTGMSATTTLAELEPRRCLPALVRARVGSSITAVVLYIAAQIAAIRDLLINLVGALPHSQSVSPQPLLHRHAELWEPRQQDKRMTEAEPGH